MMRQIVCLMIQCIVFLFNLDTTVRGFQYIGCYWSDREAGDQEEVPLRTQSTPACMDACIGDDFPYAFTDLPNLEELRCHCAEKNSLTIQSSDADCKAPCPVTRTDLCGGNGRTAVYFVGRDTVPVQLPTKGDITETSTKLSSSSTYQDSITSANPASSSNLQVGYSDERFSPSMTSNTLISADETEIVSSPKNYLGTGSSDFSPDSNIEDTASSNEGKLIPMTTVLTSVYPITTDTLSRIDDNSATTVLDSNSVKTISTNDVLNTNDIFTTSIPTSTSVEINASNSDTVSSIHVTLTTISASPFTSSMTTDFSSSTNDIVNNCLCPCSTVSNKWDFLIALNLSREELRVFLGDYLAQLQYNLTIDKKNTLHYRNTLQSAPDSRRSSEIIGRTGIVFVCVPVVLIVIADLINFLKMKKD